MSQPGGTFDTYDMSGIREDLANIIYNISPTETPFFSMSGKGKAHNTQFKWLTDSLAAAADNLQIEGDDYTGTATTATTELNNYTQISAKNFIVTGTDDAVDAAGRTTELAYLLAKNAKELKRDVEFALTATNTGKAVGSSSVARRTGGVMTWIATNQSVGTGGAAPTGDGSDNRTNGTQRAFAESQLKAVIKAAYDSGGNPDVIMVGAFNKQQLSTFTGNSTAIRDVPAKTVIAAVDVYVSDFGEMSVVPNRFMSNRSAFVLDSEYWGYNFLRNFQTHELAKTGDNTHMLLLVEGGLVSRNEAASGIVADLTSS
jgi:hypothetical protein